ncbi:MAG: RagB/SusD family nutrient uptake outer membrane protein [Cyclobacteriaceae bacterium]
MNKDRITGRAIIFGLLMSLIGFTQCEDALEEEVFVDIASNNFFQNDADAITAVNAVYAKLRADGPVTGNDGDQTQQGWGGFGYGEATIFNYQQVQTDEMTVRWANFSQFVNFTLTPSSYGNFGSVFRDMFEGIFIANNVLANIENNGNISEVVRDRVSGEALFGRALFYSTALSLFGNIPLITEPQSDPLNLPVQALPSEIAQLVIDDFTEAAGLLPVSYGGEDYGRFTKGAAYAQLARFQLNQKNWSEAINAAREVMSMGYSLSVEYADIFSIDNQSNPEIILVIPCIAQLGIGNTMIAHTSEPDFKGGWGGHLARNEFYDTFDPNDIRRTHLIQEYESVTGTMERVDDGAMIIKYEPDPNRTGPWAGNDIVLHRLGEIYLTLAEALNEENGPNQESIDLINALRDRAFDNDPSKRIALSDFDSRDALRDYILQERSWELFAENYRRDDLLRHDKYIQRAVDRGIATAQPFHVLYPIPQFEVDRNPNLVQNAGY